MTRGAAEPIRVVLADGRTIASVRAGMHAMAEIRWAFGLDAGAPEVNMTMAAMLNEHVAVAGQSLRRLGAELVVSNDADWLYVALSTAVEELVPAVREVRELLAFTPAEAAVHAATTRTASALRLAAVDLGFIADTAANATVYGAHHPYGRAPDLRLLSAVDPAVVSEALRDALASPDAHVAVAADDDPHTGIEVLMSMMESLPSDTSMRRPPVPISVPPSGRRDVIVSDTSRAQLRLIWPEPSPGETPPGVRELIAADLGGDRSSRLFHEVREMRGLCYSIRCRVVSARYASACIVSTSTTAAASEAAMESIVETVGAMIAAPPDRDRVTELDRRLRLARAIATSTPQGIADRLLRDATQGAAALEHVDADAVATHVRSVLSPSKRIDVIARGRG